MISLTAKDLSFSYGPRAVLQNFNLQISSGDFVCLLGPSGCGKSTLLRIFSNLMLPLSGSFERTPGQVSFVFQEPRLLPWRTVAENVLLPFELLGAPPVNPEEVLKTVGLWEHRGLFPHELSGGMKQRCAIARALITDPKLLLMDEPFSALDEITREGLENLLRELWQLKKMTLVFVTHSIPEAVFLGERLMLMGRHGGNIILDQRTNLGLRSDDTRTSSQTAAIARQFSHALRGAFT